MENSILGFGFGGGSGGGSANDKGFFLTYAALVAALPVGQAGWYAVVGDTDSFWLWDTATSAWVDSGVSSLTYTNANPVVTTLGGVTAGTTFVAQTMTQMWDKLLYPPTAPTVSLASVPANGTIRELGNDLASIVLNATITKKSNPITKVEYYRNNVLIYTNNSPNPSGGIDTYTDLTPVTVTTTWKVIVSDNVLSPVTSASVGITFVYPYYYGVGAVALDEAGIKALTKVLKTESNTITSNSPTNQVYYMAFPASYGALSSIIDANGFNITSDYTLRTENFTMLNGSTVSYYIYEFKNLTTQVAFTITYNI